MYAGAALSAAAIVHILLAADRIREVVADHHPRAAPAQLHGIQMETLVIFIAPQAVGIVLWIWMARANGRGRNWARVMSAAVFGLWTVYELLALTRPRDIYGVVVIGVIWLTGLAATILIFHRESADYYDYSPPDDYPPP
jgi:hypothetical protein